MFKWIRIIVLLFVFLTVWSTMSRQKTISQNWEGTSNIVVIPINADGKEETQRYIDSLNNNVYKEVPAYFDQQISRYLKGKKYVIDIQLAEPIESAPPSAPAYNSSKFDIAFWSLKLRWWMWHNKPEDYHSQQIRLYTQYSSPAKNVLLPHSIGLQKGLVGIINARAYKRSQRFNNVVIAHELLHIYGASDKYDLTTGNAIYPEGYADSSKPQSAAQRHAALMGRTLPTGNNHHEVAMRLSKTVVNPITAKEIGWIK